MTTLNHTRSFGCEIELTGLDITQAADALRAAGITTWDSTSRTMGPEINEAARPVPPYPADRCQCENHRRMWAESHGAPQRRTPTQDEINAAWRVVADGSVQGGCEVVSPILSGNAGLDTLRRVVRVLKAAGASVNNSCGFHVHVDARDLEGIEIINAVSRYARHESVIDGFMAPRRRGDRSQWCHTMTPVAQRLLADGAYSTAQGLQYLVSSRYFKLNVHAFVRHGTLEFRQHAGTMNINKMVNWIIFAVNFVETSRMAPEFMANYKEEFQEKRLAKFANILANLDSNNYYDIRTYRVASMMGMDQGELGALIEELKVRYPAFNRVRIDSYGNVVRVPQIAPADVPAAPPAGLTLPEPPGVFDGLPEATATYLQGRAAGYASPLRRRARLDGGSISLSE